MTDRFITLTVALERDIREDDAESLINAIRHLRGVADVKGNISDHTTYAVETRIRREFTDRIHKALNDAI